PYFLGVPSDLEQTIDGSYLAWKLDSGRYQVGNFVFSDKSFSFQSEANGQVSFKFPSYLIKPSYMSVFDQDGDMIFDQVLGRIHLFQQDDSSFVRTHIPRPEGMIIQK